jgi:hypothetical protein
VAAFFTDVLIVFGTLSKSDIVVPAEKARKRMSHSGGPRTKIENRCTASSARRAGLPGNLRVIDFVTDECATG